MTLPRCLYCCVARRVDCCVYFVSPIPPRAFRVASGLPLRCPRNCWIPGLLLQEVDYYLCHMRCYRSSRAPRAIFICGCSRKNTTAVSGGYQPVLSASRDDHRWHQASSAAVMDKGGSPIVVVASWYYVREGDLGLWPVPHRTTTIRGR